MSRANTPEGRLRSKVTPSYIPPEIIWPALNMKLIVHFAWPLLFAGLLYIVLAFLMQRDKMRRDKEEQG